MRVTDVTLGVYKQNLNAGLSQQHHFWAGLMAIFRVANTNIILILMKIIMKLIIIIIIIYILVSLQRGHTTLFNKLDCQKDPNANFKMIITLEQLINNINSLKFGLQHFT